MLNNRAMCAIEQNSHGHRCMLMLGVYSSPSVNIRGALGPVSAIPFRVFFDLEADAF
jgi:hypothetical protein